jgi:hypothetical protein
VSGWTQEVAGFDPTSGTPAGRRRRCVVRAGSAPAFGNAPVPRARDGGCGRRLPGVEVAAQGASDQVALACVLVRGAFFEFATELRVEPDRDDL